MNHTPHYEHGSSPVSESMRRIEGYFERNKWMFRETAPVASAVRPPKESKQLYRWTTPEEKAEILRLWNKGLPAYVIAKRTGRIRNSVRGILIRMGADMKAPRKAITA